MVQLSLFVNCKFEAYPTSSVALYSKVIKIQQMWMLRHCGPLVPVHHEPWVKRKGGMRRRRKGGEGRRGEGGGLQG